MRPKAIPQFDVRLKLPLLPTDAHIRSLVYRRLHHEYGRALTWCEVDRAGKPRQQQVTANGLSEYKGSLAIRQNSRQRRTAIHLQSDATGRDSACRSDRYDDAGILRSSDRSRTDAHISRDWHRYRVDYQLGSRSAPGEAALAVKACPEYVGAGRWLNQIECRQAAGESQA